MSDRPNLLLLSTANLVAMIARQEALLIMYRGSMGAVPGLYSREYQMAMRAELDRRLPVGGR